MRKGYESRAMTNWAELPAERRTIDLCMHIREMQMQSAISAERDEEVAYLLLPGKWTPVEFGRLLSDAA